MSSQTIAQDMKGYAGNPGSRMLHSAAWLAGGLALVTSIEDSGIRYRELAPYIPPTQEEKEIFESMGPPATYQEAIDQARDDFLSESGYTGEECRKCSLMDDPEYMEVADHFRNPRDLIMAMADTESRVRQFVRAGKGKKARMVPIMSRNGAYGILQLKDEASDEVYEIFNDDKSWHRRYQEEFDTGRHSDSLGGSREAARKRMKNDKMTNWIEGNAYFSYHASKEGGNIREALMDYKEGRRGKLRHPKRASNYADKVLKKRGFYKDCESKLRKFRSYQAHLDTRKAR